MKGSNAFWALLLVMVRVTVCAGQANAVEEYTIRIETRERNGRPLPATLTITNEKNRKVQRGTLQSGSYTVALAAGTVYRLDAVHTGYRPVHKILRLDRVIDPNQARQTIVLELEREVSTESPVNVTVIDFETKQLIRQKLNVQLQEFDGKRVIMTGPPREGRFTFLAEFGQRIRFTVETPGYQPYEYTVDVRDQHDITIPLQRFRKPVADEAPANPANEPGPQAGSSPVTAAPATPPSVAPSSETTTLPTAAKAAPTTIPPGNAETKPAAPVTNDLSALTAGKTVTLNNVYFDQSSYLLRPESHVQLNQLVGLLKSRPELKIEISGHTDNVGDPRLNLALSENRARVIMSYLMTNGIAENRLRSIGYGQTRPIAANDTEENKRKNRRVEVRVLRE